MRETLATRFSDTVRPFTYNCVTDQINYKGLKQIHTQSVASAIHNQGLPEPAPPINWTYSDNLSTTEIRLLHQAQQLPK